jgi:hypothetical protein
MAKELVAVLDGSAKPRVKTPVPDISETASALTSIYESL